MGKKYLINFCVLFLSTVLDHIRVASQFNSILTGFTSNKMSLAMLQISVLLLGLLIIGSWAAPSADELQEIYEDSCQSSCSVVKNDDEANECREKFCSNYVSYLFTGSVPEGSTPSLATSQRKEVAEFCSTWMLNLIKELGWHRRIRLNLKECTCAAGKDCLVK